MHLAANTGIPAGRLGPSRRMALVLATAAAFAMPSVAAAERQPTSHNFANALAQVAGRHVTYQDMLGEGPGHWDADPRYPTDSVNCIVWLREFIAEYYAQGHKRQDKTKVMDSLRYYAGQVGFSTRKHYNLRWLMLEPGPLQAVDTSACGTRQTRQVSLGIEQFKQHHQYSCPLYQEQQQHFEFNYLSRDDTLQCLKTLTPEQPYILFLLPSQAYIQHYGKSSGTMGLAHGLVIDASQAEPVAHHASILSGNVVTEPLQQFSNRSQRYIDGYVLYTLDPNWQYDSTTHEAPAKTPPSELLQCEQQLALESVKQSQF